MSKKVIAQLHGINTTAKWQGTFSDAAQYVGWKSDLKRWYYGKFSVFRFLLPWQRSSKVYWFRNNYTELKYDKSFAKDLDDDHPPSIVAHSFGTYILGYSLVKFPNIKFDKVIVCGSILPKDFPWDELLERGQVIAIRNEYGTADIRSDITRWFVGGTGPSGKTGFDCKHSRLIQQESATFKHSDYFERGHMDSFWIPFIRKEVSADFHRTSPARLPRASIPWGLYAIYLMIGVALATYFIPWERVTGAAQIATLQSQLKTATDHISTLQSQLEAAQQASAKVSGSAPASQSDENARQIAALQSQLNQAQQERDHAVQNLGTLQSELSSKNVELGNIRQHVTTLQSQLSETQKELTDIQNRDQTRIGPNTAVNFVNALTLSDALKTIPKTLVLLTSTPDNEQLRYQLEIIFNAARARLGGNSPLIIMGRPNYEKELDAPRLQETPGNGITIHGRNPAGDYLMEHVLAMNNCFNRRQTAKTPDEFLTYYHLIGGANDIKDIAWIEIGHSPVLNGSGCLNQ